ncbi:MAG: rhomboid family intramembrane serine protease [Bryobacteraceae bacterium]
MDRRNPGEILGGLIPQARFTTILILIINFALYGATLLYSQRTGLDFNKTLYLFGAKVGLRYLDGQWWRLVTAGFLHGGVIHILMNSWVLFDLGAEVEAAYGTARMIVFYFVSTVTGFLLSAWWAPTLSIGASAGLMGLIGAMIAWGMTERTTMASAMKSQYIRWAVYIMLFGFIIPGIDNAAHIGGAIGGFAIAFVLSTPRARLMWREPLIRAAAAVAVLTTVACFALMFRFMLVAQQELLK